MITLHKPQRTTYGQAVEAQREFNSVKIIEDPPELICKGIGTLICCC